MISGGFLYIWHPKQAHHLGKHETTFMARSYPRFLFSNPINTKSKGPFIIHTIYPKCILKADISDSKTFEITILDWLEDSKPISTGNISPELRILDAAGEWLFSQLFFKQIVI